MNVALVIIETFYTCVRVIGCHKLAAIISKIIVIVMVNHILCVEEV